MEARVSRMSQSPATSESGFFKLPSSTHEFWALFLAVVIVFLLVQLGAPIVRSLEFLDPKLRDYFIGMSFAAFPLIHRGCKQGIGRFRIADEPVLQDSAAWYVSGIVAGAVLFGWNQFAAFLAGLSLEISRGAYPDPTTLNLDLDAFSTMQTTAALAVVLPLCAVASVYAGMLLNRHTRSHTVAAVAIAAVFFVTANTMTTWAVHPEMIEQIVAVLQAGGEDAVQLVFGLSLVGLIVFVCGVGGTFISRMNRERPIGMIVEAARKLSPDKRQALAQELMQRAREGQVSGAGGVQAAVTPHGPQLPTGAEP